MAIATLEIQHVRNIGSASLHFSPSLNVITGLNASGKTSLLEAVSLLIQGKSFRTPRIDQLIMHGEQELRVLGGYRQGVHQYKVGLQRQGKKTLVKVNGQLVSRTTELVGNLPLFILTPESHELLASGPKVRRQFLDWGVFHVEHRYLAHWQRFHRVLRQRNSSLRHQGKKAEILAWNRPLAEEAGHLHTLRTQYISNLETRFAQYCQQLLGLTVQLQYRPGWEAKTGLEQGLIDTYEQDFEKGYTTLGPQRADLRFLSSGDPIQAIFSRGQQKLLICALVLAQLTALKGDALLLVDDLPAELDPQKRLDLLEALRSTGKQIMVTTTEASLLDTGDWPQKKMFHVEHGQIQEMV